MHKPNPVEYKNFVIVATANEQSSGHWRGAFHISLEGKIIREEEVKNLSDSDDSAEHSALLIAKEIIDEIIAAGSIKLRYRGSFIKMRVTKVKDWHEGARWHALVTIEGLTGLSSEGFIETSPAGTCVGAILEGVKAGEAVIDKLSSRS